MVEGLHGRPFRAPLTRMRETLDILRLAFAGEKLEYHGRFHELPLPGGEGKALRLAQPGNPNTPIYLAPPRMGMAFQLGAMGSPNINFYNEAYRRGGREEAATEVQRLWVAGQRDAAAERVPEEMIVQANLLGDEAMVRERIRAYRDAGVTTLRVAPAGTDQGARLDTLGRVMDLLRGLS